MKGSGTLAESVMCNCVALDVTDAGARREEGGDGRGEEASTRAPGWALRGCQSPDGCALLL